MGAELNLDLWGHRLTVRASPREALSALRSDLGDHVISEGAPVEFLVKEPENPQGLHSVLDRSGLVLARARTWHDCVAVLVEQLATFVLPPAGTVRTTMRALVRSQDEGRDVVLAGFPLLSLPPLVERQLERRGQQIVDRLAVDVTSEMEMVLSPLPWPAHRGKDPAGHCGAGASGSRIAAVLVPHIAGITPMRHQMVASIAGTFRNVNVSTALDLAERLAPIARDVPIANPAALRDALTS